MRERGGGGHRCQVHLLIHVTEQSGLTVHSPALLRTYEFVDSIIWRCVAVASCFAVFRFRRHVGHTPANSCFWPHAQYICGLQERL